MYKEVPGLVLYRDLGQDSILYCMADIFEAWEEEECEYQGGIGHTDLPADQADSGCGNKLWLQPESVAGLSGVFADHK